MHAYIPHKLVPTEEGYVSVKDPCTIALKSGEDVKACPMRHRINTWKYAAQWTEGSFLFHKLWRSDVH